MGAPGGRGLGREYEIVGVVASGAPVGTWPDVQIDAGVITPVSVQGRAQAVSIMISPNIHIRFRNMERFYCLLDQMQGGYYTNCHHNVSKPQIKKEDCFEDQGISTYKSECPYDSYNSSLRGRLCKAKVIITLMEPPAHIVPVFRTAPQYR